MRHAFILTIFFLLQKELRGIILRVLLTSAPETLFKHSKRSNYSFKKSNSSISKGL